MQTLPGSCPKGFKADPLTSGKADRFQPDLFARKQEECNMTTFQ